MTRNTQPEWFWFLRISLNVCLARISLRDEATQRGGSQEVSANHGDIPHLGVQRLGRPLYASRHSIFYSGLILHDQWRCCAARDPVLDCVVGGLELRGLKWSFWLFKLPLI